MKLYQQAQQKYKTDIKKKVKRQVQVVKPDATDDDVERVLRSEGGRDALYKEKMLAGGINDQVKWVAVVHVYRIYLGLILMPVKGAHMQRLLENTRMS